MRSRWLSRRALGLHAALLVWSPGCLVAGWWQVTRALGGNPLSYLYSVEWPVFALVGIWGWWTLIHTDPETVGARAQRRALAEQAKLATPAGEPVPQVPVRRTEDEDPELAAYNDQLAALSASGVTKTWRRK